MVRKDAVYAAHQLASLFNCFNRTHATRFGHDFRDSDKVPNFPTRQLNYEDSWPYSGTLTWRLMTNRVGLGYRRVS
jgi:hypothetical protein